VPGSAINFTIKGYIENHYGININFMGPVAAVSVAFAIFFAFVFSFYIKVFFTNLEFKNDVLLSSIKGVQMDINKRA